MKAPLGLFLAGLTFTLTVAVTALFAADPPTSGILASPNAAVIYWQAFAAMPTLEGEHKTKYEAVIKTTTEPVTDDLQPIVGRFDNALRELHRARGVAVCDWNLHYDDGPELLLPHLQKARELSRAALLRARLRFAAQATDEAVADSVAVLKMARDCGSSPLLVSLLVGIAIENMATEVLTANLTRLSPPQLDGLAAALRSLPAPSSAVECMRLEGRIFGDWVERFLNAEAARLNDPQAGGKALAALLEQMNGSSSPDANEPDADQRRKLLEALTVADVQASLRRLRADYAEVAKIAGLPSADRRGRWTEFETQLAETRKSAQPEDILRTLSHVALPAISKVSEREDQFQVRQQLLLLAIQALRHGPDAIKGATVPGHGPIEYRQTDAGFELRCQPGSAGQPEVLQVGAAR